MIAASGLTAAEIIAACLEHTTGQRVTDEAIYGPPEQVTAQADLDWLADREEAREQRWRGVA